MTLLRRMFLSLLALVWAGPALANEPLVIIRFNQPRVYYSQQLYQALSKAVQIKPGVMVEVVSYAPLTDDSGLNEKWVKHASAHTQGVVAELQKMGFPRERIRVTGQPQAGIRYDETHIYVH